MLGIRKFIKSKSNKLYIEIPNELKDKELEIIIMPKNEENVEDIHFWTEEELNKLSKIQLSSSIPDNEDYSKW